MAGSLRRQRQRGAIKLTDNVAAEHEGREITQANMDADAAASDAETTALDAQVVLPPLTAAGMRAAIEYVAALDIRYVPAATEAFLAKPLESPTLNG